jgi:hypothetical protein
VKQCDAYEMYFEFSNQLLELADDRKLDIGRDMPNRSNTLSVMQLTVRQKSL